MTEPAAPSLIVAGGGTAGHLWAGVAVADRWKQAHPGARIVFVGAKGGIEEKLVPKAGYPLETLKLGSLMDATVAKKIRTLLQLPIAFLRSGMILLRERPAAVIGVGGYASGPLVLMARVLAWLTRSRVSIVEQNAVPGFTNRVLGRFAHRVYVAFPGVEKQFTAKKALVTGNPIRASIQSTPSAARDPFTVFVFGGSLGAMGINSLVLDAIPHLADLMPRLRIIHQTGEKDFERVRDGHARLGTQARVEKFIYDMPECYAQASLVVCRGGSSTLSELAAIGRASAIVPFPYHSDQQQEKNARIFVDAGAARLLRQLESKGEDLARLIRELHGSPEKLVRMEEQARTLHRSDAAGVIVRDLSGDCVRS